MQKKASGEHESDVVRPLGVTSTEIVSQLHVVIPRHLDIDKGFFA